MTDAVIIIGIYGDKKRWLDIASKRAIPSAMEQGVPVIISYDHTLARARNAAGFATSAEWLIFLDADDQLSSGYVDALMEAEGDLRAPAVQFIKHGIPQKAELLNDRDIEATNPCVIGTAIRQKMFAEIGGFQEFSAWEDYALFLKAYRRGAKITHNEKAVYVVHASNNSRNNRVSDPGLFSSIHSASWGA